VTAGGRAECLSPPLAGAVLLKALRAAAADLEHPHGGQPPDVAETRPAAQPSAPTSSSLADALLVIAEAFLAEKIAAADDPEVYQVIVHVGTDATTPASPAADAADVSAETVSTYSSLPWRSSCLAASSPGLALHSWRRNGASFRSAAGSCVSSPTGAAASVSAAARDRAAKSPPSPLCPMHHCVHSGSRRSAALA
jgi:hypothetical protein